MRNNIVHQGVGELTYEIRGIVEVAEKIKKFGTGNLLGKYRRPGGQGLPDTRMDKRYCQKGDKRK